MGAWLEPNALWRLSKEPGIAGIGLEGNEFEVDELPLNERQCREELLGVGDALAFEHEDGRMTVLAEVGLAHDARLVEGPERPSLVFEMWREGVGREAGRFDLKREDSH